MKALFTVWGIALLGLIIAGCVHYSMMHQKHNGPLDIDFSNGSRQTMVADFIWPQGNIGTITLPFDPNIKVYICGLDGTPVQPVIVCSIKYTDDKGVVHGGTIEKELETELKPNI